MAKRSSENRTRFFSVKSKPFGKTYGEWTVNCWQWALSTPKSINPVVDKTGAYADVNQPSANVWFLAGKFGNEEQEIPQRRCTIPVGRAILFPIINCEANQLEYPELKTEKEIIDHVSRDEDTIVKKECLVNGETIPIERVRSDPLTFFVTISKDNALGVKGGGSTIAAADGYWVFLKPLPKGEHTVTFSGSCENGRLNSGANYCLSVR